MTQKAHWGGFSPRYDHEIRMSIKVAPGAGIFEFRFFKEPMPCATPSS